MKTYRTFPYSIDVIDEKSVTLNNIEYVIIGIEELDKNFGFQRLQVLLQHNNEDFLLELNLQFDASSEDMSIAYFFAKIKITGEKQRTVEPVTTYEVIEEIKI